MPNPEAPPERKIPLNSFRSLRKHRPAASTDRSHLIYLRFHAKDFNVYNVRYLGVILMVSGSPAD